MLVVIACLVAAAAAKPALYDQRQDGEMNVRADVQNVVFIVPIPQKLPFSLTLFDLFMKNAKQRGHEAELQERADVHSMESFLEPSTPYRVEISGDGIGTPAPVVKPVSGNRYVEGEVVIAGRRSNNNRVEADIGDGLKLLGAQEQCGFGRVRDEEGICRDEPLQPIEHEYKDQVTEMAAAATVEESKKPAEVTAA